MDTELAQRLDAQERLLHVIVSALASECPEGSSGFDDLIEVLADLTEAVADMSQAVRSLHSDVFARFPPSGH
ncbi:hypothetical protein DA075_13490 [Methylobacterium currus]|uniref:Uncharacterized protein n=1 Tax=Methylobacterium currus TaxID=2051553 RepID=A0A2R4WJV6_9HYPH|nr:hypothetical protein DA075_13490 [Methylobacterium currus]